MTNVQTPSQSSQGAIEQSQSGKRSTSRQLPMAWIERLFEKLSGFYGARFADMWRGCDIQSVKGTWAEGLADMSKDELMTGLEQCKNGCKFPPTLPEFRLLCRPAIDAEVAYFEAVREFAKRKHGNDNWSSPVIFWAAANIGSDLLGTSYNQIKARWQAEIAKQADAQRKGILQPIPPRREALPKPGATQTPRADAISHLAKVREQLRGKMSMERAA